MNTVTSHIFWKSISEKLEKGESLNPETLVWDYVSEARTTKEKDFTESSRLITERLSEILNQRELADDGLKELYDKEMGEKEKALEERKRTIDLYRSEAKKCLGIIRKAKINSKLKNGIGERMNFYADMLESEIKEIKHGIIDFETWKKDLNSLFSTQIPYLQNRLKEAMKNDEENKKIISEVKAAFPCPSGFVW